MIPRVPNGYRRRFRGSVRLGRFLPPRHTWGSWGGWSSCPARAAMQSTATPARM